MAERLTAGAMPVPERLTVCGLPAALSANTIEAVRVPAELGLKVTVSLHWSEGASAEPQLLDRLKSPALDPLTSMLERVRLALPLLASVADKGALAMPTSWLAKSIVVGLKEKPAVGIGATTEFPPPPQEIQHTAPTMQTKASNTSLTWGERSGLATILHDFPAGAVPASDGFVS